MEKPTLEYDGNLGKEQVRLLVKAYFHEKRLYIGLIKGEDGEPGLFDDLTVNLPNEPAWKSASGDRALRFL